MKKKKTIAKILKVQKKFELSDQSLKLIEKFRANLEKELIKIEKKLSKGNK